MSVLPDISITYLLTGGSHRPNIWAGKDGHVLLFSLLAKIIERLHFFRLARISGKQNRVSLLFGIVIYCAFVSSCEAGGDSSMQVKSFSNDRNKGVMIRVLWTVSSYHIGPDATWGDEEAKRMIFKPLDIRSSTITFDGDTCHNVTFSRESVDAKYYLTERFQMTPEAFSLKRNIVEVIRTNCSLPGFSEYVRLPDRRLLVPIQGVVFVFEPAVNY